MSLLGVDSVMAPATLREPAWSRLARDLDASVLERMSRVIALADTLAAAHDTLNGTICGRVVVDVDR